jgi:hypothetical protein
MGNFNVGVYNEDITNIIWVSRSPSFQAGATNAAPIQPLTTGVFSAARPLYAISASGTIIVTITPEGESINPSPAQIAAQINTLGLATEATQASQTTGATIATDVNNTGVPLVGKSALLFNSSGTVNAGTTTTLGPVSSSKISYSAALTGLVDLSAGTTNAVVTVTYFFIDSTTGQTVDKCSFDIFPDANGGSGRSTIFRGPMSADRVTVTIQNRDTANVAYVFQMVESSHVYSHDHKFLSTNNPAATGQTTASQDTTGGLIIDTQPSIASGATATRQLPLFNGRVGIHMGSLSSLAAVYTVTSRDAQATNDGTVWAAVMTPPPTHEYHEFIMPRSHCQLAIKNNGASTGNLAATMIILDN